jgi:hypothetical protein
MLMNQSPENEGKELDPFAGLSDELLSRRKLPKLPTRTVFRRAAAYFLFVCGLLLMAVGIWLGLDGEEVFFVKLAFVAGLGACGLAYAVYDWRWPETIGDAVKRFVHAVVRSFK